ncbi:Shedu anti-phage system protein SduA domain-containing protein [Scytonema sp. PCC 10023]|uniref:Shedu anti-phage system protein SduA domain-containing protein n=1 Tax=Scytonema sp. PCC 10023 TaxID=1680591 RepID=UPI0039C70AC2
MTLKNKLVKALDQAKGEREIHAFLKEEPLLVWATFMNCGGHSDYVIPEFSLSGKYYADFVVMQSFSGGWNIAFIELEPVDEKPFNQHGNPSKRLRGAIKQIDDWQDFEKDEGASLRSHLADAAQKYDTLYPERNLAREPWCVKMPLRDPKTYLCCEYFIVMGRRSHFDEKLIHVKSKFARHHNNVEILTYDRFIEVAEKLNQQNEYYKSRKIEKEDKDFLVQFAEDPEQFSISGNRDIHKYPSEMNVHGTCYKILSNEEGDGFVVDILGTLYEIFEDRRTFSLNRIEPDGLGLPVAVNLESLSAAIQLAEIYERFIYFHIDTKHSLDLVDECLQFLRENLPYKIEAN